MLASRALGIGENRGLDCLPPSKEGFVFLFPRQGSLSSPLPGPTANPITGRGKLDHGHDSSEVHACRTP